MSHFLCTFFGAGGGTHDALRVCMESYAVGLGLHCNRSVKNQLCEELSVLKVSSLAMYSNIGVDSIYALSILQNIWSLNALRTHNFSVKCFNFGGLDAISFDKTLKTMIFQGF